MALPRRKEQKKHFGISYDAEGRELPKALVSPPPHSLIAVWDEFNLLKTHMSNYHEEHRNFIARLSDGILPEQIIATIESLLFSADADSKAIDITLDKLFHSVCTFAAKAVSAREGVFLGVGSDEAAYTEAAGLLRKVGKYVASKIIETPPCTPVAEKAYLLTALQDSPEVFLAARNNAGLKTHIKELNQIKTDISKMKPAHEHSDIQVRVKGYVSQIKTLEVKIQSIDARFGDIGTKCAQRILKIENNRANRWFPNFLADIYKYITTGESEKDELKRLSEEKSVNQALERSYHTLSDKMSSFRLQSVLQSLGNQLLTTASGLGKTNLVELRTVIQEILSGDTHDQDVKAFVKDLEKSILTIITEKLEISSDFNSILANQFAFLAESEVKDIKQLNEVRKTVLQSINDKLTGFGNPVTALKFIVNLEQTKPECMDASLADNIARIKADYTAWNNINAQGQTLLTASLTKEAIAELHLSVVRALQSKLPLVKKAGTELDVMLRDSIQLNISAFKQCNPEQVDELARMMGQHLSFYASPGLHAEEISLSTSKDVIREAIRKSFDNLNPVEAMAYISKWEKLGSQFNQFDSTLFQDIQNRKNQYKSLQVLENGWDDLLRDKVASQLSADEGNQFIAAVLWLDKPKHEANVIVDFFKSFTTSEQDVCRVAAKEKLAELNLILAHDLAQLAEKSLSQDKSAALGRRLRFVTKANSMYTVELSSLREHVLQAIRDHLQFNLSIQDTKRYLNDLTSILPEELKSDVELSRLILKAKETLVKNDFTAVQTRLYQNYKNEIDFLKTGDISLWDTIKQTIQGEDRRALTLENIQYWRTGFIKQYDALRRQKAMEVKDAPYRAGDSQADKKIIAEYLDVLIAEDMKSISSTLVDNLMQLADMRRKQALAKLDKIFGLRPDKPVDINLFTFRYFAVAEYQRHCRIHPAAGRAGSDFVRKFHEMAQNSGGFTTQIIAKLPYDALEEMYSTWSENPEVTFSRNSSSLARDIIGKVDDSRDTYIQVPQYLMLFMVLELIAVDFEAKMRGSKVNENLLEGRIKFAIPHYQQLLRFESELNTSSDGLGLRKTLLLELNKLNDAQLNAIKSKFIRDLENTEVNILDIVRDFPEDITSKLPAATGDMVHQLQYRFSERYRNVMVKLLANENFECMDKSDSSANIPVIQEQKQPDVWESAKVQISNFCGGLFASKKPSEPVCENQPTTQERVKQFTEKLNPNLRSQMFQQLVPVAEKNNVDLNAASEAFQSSLPIKIQGRPMSGKKKHFDNNVSDGDDELFLGYRK